MIDYRERQHRREAFVKWFGWSVAFKDCDTALWTANYLNQRFEHNTEQELWFAWLYGNTYHLPSAWVLMNEFPDYELATLDRLTSWNDANYKRLRYQTDTKWNKGHLPEMYASYARFIGAGLQREKFEQYLCGNDYKSFHRLWEAITKELHKFGRYSTWFYLQQLKHTASIPITPTGLMLNDYSGSRSHRNGLLLALGHDDMVDSKMTPQEYSLLEGEAQELLLETAATYPKHKSSIDLFAMETALCSFKKLFRSTNSRYLGYYLDRQAEEIIQCEKDGWHGIDWRVLWEARWDCVDYRLARSRSIKKDWFTLFNEGGVMIRSEWI